MLKTLTEVHIKDSITPLQLFQFRVEKTDCVTESSRGGWSHGLKLRENIFTYWLLNYKSVEIFGHLWYNHKM